MMGVSAGYLSQFANGGRPWTPKMRQKVAAVLGEVPGQGTVYRQGGVVTGESSFIRERAREMGMTMRDLADRAGVSYGYMSGVARGRVNMGVKVQTRIESALKAPAKIAPAQCANRPASVVSGESSYVRERARALGMTMRELAERVGVSASYMSEVSRGRRGMGVRVQALVEAALEAEATVASAQLACVDTKAVWDRMDAHGLSQNEVARRAGISSSYLSQIMNGKSTPSAGVLKRLHAVLFRRAKSEERVMPAEVKVLGWRKGERSGMVVHGAGRLSMTPVLMPGYSAMLSQPEPSLWGEAVVDAAAASPGFPCMPPFFVALNQRPASTSLKWGTAGAHVRAAALPRRLPLARAAPHLQRLAGQPPRSPRRGVPRLDAEDGLEVLDGALEPGRVHAGDSPAVEDVPVPGVDVEDPAVVLYRQLVLLQAAVGQPPGRQGLGVAGL